MNKTLKYLVFAIVVLTILATGIGLLSNTVYEQTNMTSVNGATISLYGKGIYHNDSISIAAQAKGQDLTTLLIAIPSLIAATYYTYKKSIAAKLVLAGVLAYFLYSYISYVFLAQYNPLFIVYIALMGLSFFAFTICITSLDSNKIKQIMPSSFPRKKLAVFLIFFSIMMMFRSLSIIIPTITSNIIPVELEHYTSLVIQAMDLSILLPSALLGGILLYKDKPLGYVISIVIIIKFTPLGVAILAMLAFMANAGAVVKLSEVILFSIIGITLIFVLLVVLKNLKNLHKRI
ncbi:hypothetical protein EDD63_10637 [Breznakia blatticola]|uniref:Uncharacterized protein n=1 Tax=Breznakia blatticola TaxID=1754012 RepID=A0A4R8A465_9FIRM|nr:hypothetical protein [Breznakia blatticola]TDW25096.1 hypothetical protein EDD63_10637 [Breznakia blatticola]